MKHFLFAALAFNALAATVLGADPNPHGPPGVLTLERWAQAWPGCEWSDGIKEGRVSVVQREGRKRYRVDYTPGEIGPEKNGVGWRCPIGTRAKGDLAYTVRFCRDFEWGKGGKLPGLGGGPENASGGKPANGSNGFSARLMWRADGRGEAYVYHKNQEGKYGDSFVFPESFRFPTETDIRIRLHVEMNTPGARNGKLQVWVALNGPQSEQLVVDRADLEWRAADTFGVDSVYFETFYGGGDQSWAPKRAASAEFGDIQINK